MDEPVKKLSKSDYEEAIAQLHEELVYLQEWVKNNGLKIVVIFEGRDAAGKGGVIKRITEPFANPLKLAQPIPEPLLQLSQEHRLIRLLQLLRLLRRHGPDQCATRFTLKIG